METPILKDMTRIMYSEKYICKHYPEFYSFLQSRYADVSFREKLYMYFNNLTEPKRCKVCGKQTKFDNFVKGYRIYCSSKCCNSDGDKKEQTKCNLIRKYGVENPSQLESVKQKKIDTCLKNYGVENPFQSNDVKDIIKLSHLSKYGVEHPSQAEVVKEKTKRTNITKYGVEHPSQLESVKQKKIDTCLKNYGVEHPSQAEVVKEKKTLTSVMHYGVEHPSQAEVVKEKTKRTFNENYMSLHPDIIQIFENDGERTYVCCCTNTNCKMCDECQFTIQHGLYHSRKYQGLELCTKLNPIDHKGKDTTIEQFIKNILDSYHIYYETNVRIVNNLEIDIYIPSRNIGIECNGIYWHSDKVKQPKYHYNKYKAYLENGIQLLMFWEDWIKTKPSIVESILLSKLGLYTNKIYARKCIVKQIDSKLCNNFLEQNHIQGKCNSSVRYGLFYDDKLMSVMTFSKKRRSMVGNKQLSDNEWELTRFCNLKQYQVNGGASKLLKCFVNEYKPNTIVSFASHDISNGSLYEVLGFTKETETSGSYWYVDYNMIRFHRYTFRKSELVKKGYDANESEFEIMDRLKYYRIYDSGQSKYILTIKGSL